jgi:hypothetical protein
MKLKKTARRFDDALFLLLQLHTLLEGADTLEGAKIAAVRMEAPLGELGDILDSLERKAR